MPLRPSSCRFASTDTKSTPIAEVKSAYPSTASQSGPDASHPVESIPPTPLNAHEAPSSFDSTAYDGQPPVNEYIGYLKDMGLDYGWGPTAFVETLLEYIHIYTGSPWWASVALTIVAIRLSIFKLYINAQDSSARQAAIRPLLLPLEKRQKAAMAAADQQGIRAVQEDRRKLNEEYGIKVMNLFWPIIVQIPMGFGTFRLMRGMAGLPVPGFDEGGFLWLSDLTIPDPFYILPLATAATYYWTFRVRDF